MMTWVSLRSGMASSGTRLSDHQPAAQPTATSAKTTSLFLMEKSMTRSIIKASRAKRSQRVLVLGRLRPPEVALGGRPELLPARLGAEQVALALVLEHLPCRLGLGLVHVHPADRVPGGRAVDAGGGGLDPALRVHQERTGEDDALAGR